jgi:hypothetical protein
MRPEQPTDPDPRAAMAISIGDVVQIDPAHDEMFGAALMVVEEIKSWGLQGYVNVPGQGLAYYRVPNGKFVRIGKAVWIQDAGWGCAVES